MAAEVAAANAAIDARGGQVDLRGMQQQQTGGPSGGVIFGEDIDEVLLRRVLYVSGEEKQEHVSSYHPHRFILPRLTER